MPAEFAFGADFAGDTRDFRSKAIELVDHDVNRVLQLENFSFGIDGDVTRQVAFGHSRCDVGDITNLGRKVSRHTVDVIGKILPYAGNTGDARLSTQLAFGADLARHTGNFCRKRVESVDHRVDGVLELEDFTLGFDRDFARQIAVGDRRRDQRDIAHLAGEVRAHPVDVLGEIFPNTTYTADFGLTA